MNPDLDAYERRGDLSAPHALTSADKRRQRQAEEISEAVAKQFRENPPPSIPGDIRREIAHVLKLPKMPWELMRWCVRWFCGHESEHIAHWTHKSIHAAFSFPRCRECGKDPAVVVAAEAVGLVEPKPEPVVTAADPLTGRRRKDLEARALKLEAELAAIRVQLQQRDL